MADVKPNNTLYINNLNEKVKKEGEWETLAGAIIPLIPFTLFQS